ncbi:MAG: hypothetical protein WD080_10645 [Egibacteraceae bacterium]
MVLPSVPPPPDEPGWSRPSERARPGLPTWLLPALLLVVLVALAVLGMLSYTQRQEVERLRADLTEAEERIAELEAGRAAGGGGLGELLDDLFGGGDGDLDGLLDGLLDGDLDLEGLFGGLLGGAGGLEDLLGGAGGADLTRCLAGGGADGMLGGDDPIVADDLDEQVDAAVERVEAMRGLAFQEPVETELVPTAEFVARITELVSEDYTATDADRDRRVLAALGAVERDADMRALILDLVGEQAAGFYSTDTGELVVGADDPAAPLRPAGLVILAHELQHAAADQNLGLPVDHHDGDGGDEARAGLALVEGDATLFMQQFALGALELMDQLAMATDPSVAASQEQITGFPEYLQRELVFPYTEGMAFVCSLYADGGWPAVDAAYDALPTTTAQILWPERYTAGEPAVTVAGLGAPGGSWSQARTTTFGAAELLWLFSAPGDDAGAGLDAPRERAAAWAGGQLELWTDGADSAVGIALAQRADEPDLCASMAAWHAAAFPDAQSVSTTGDEALAARGQDQHTVVVCAGDRVRVGVAPDLATARQVAG